MFNPDYNNIVLSAKNVEVQRTPLYDHIVADEIIEKITGKPLANMNGNENDRNEYFKDYTLFFKNMGYDAVSFEAIITKYLIGGGSLYGHAPSTIKDRTDFDKYPWGEVIENFKRKAGLLFSSLRKNLPLGMKAIGGVGNGIFEIVQDLVGYEKLCYISYDDPELYADLFKKTAELMYSIWSWFLPNFKDVFCVCRFGDDLGYKVGTLLSPKDIRKHIIPGYKVLVNLIHSYDRPFLLHSCGKIFDVFDDIIAIGIDAKHSNEDIIAPFTYWVDTYGDKIGNFGGIDTDHLCTKDEKQIREIVNDVMKYCSKGHKGFAIGSGNSIPDYIDPAKYLAMNTAVREIRGDYK